MLHLCDLQVSYDNLTARVHLLHELVLDLRASCHTQRVLRACTHCKERERKREFTVTKNKCHLKVWNFDALMLTKLHIFDQEYSKIVKYYYNFK